jgi:hypothetical protein
MRAKFVPAESLYPTAPPVMQMEKKPMVSMPYGAVDYSAFTQPMTPVHPTGMHHLIQTSNEQTIPQGDTFGMSDYVNQITEEDDSNSFMRTFNYGENVYPASNGFASNPTSIVSPFTISTNKRANGKSKFGFEYESLTESIDDLELTNSSDKE